MQVASRSSEWSLPGLIAFRFAAPFVVLMILTIPFGYHYIPDPGILLSPYTSRLAEWISTSILHLSPPFNSRLLSDSTGLYVNGLTMGILSAIICLFWSLLDRKRRNYERGLYWLTVLASYYLALHLMIYGFNKVFKWQFHLPEPNLLYTRVGDTPRDILYWSLMGTSHPYSVFAGVVEVLAALLLFFRRTRLAGSLLSIALLINIVAINFAFDISVKLHSSFLLFLAIIITIPSTPKLFSFFFRDRTIDPVRWKPVYFTTAGAQASILLKGLIIPLLLFDVLSVYIESGNYNDDLMARPPMHGAYEFVTESNAGLRSRWNRGPKPLWKRFFIHRDGYFITQDESERMKDYRFRLDTVAKEITLIDDERDGRRKVMRYIETPTGRIRIWERDNQYTTAFEYRQVMLDTLPLLQNEFHWTVDEIREED